MCTYNITVDDKLLERARPALGRGTDVAKWMQQQIEVVINQIVAQYESQSMPVFDENYMAHAIAKSAPMWKGVSDADAWIHELRGE